MASTRPRGQDEPAQSQPGRERLARGSGVGDEVRGETLHGPDGSPVVAVLGVVVVLDDERLPLARPAQHGGAALGREHRSGGPLVGGREDQGVGVRAVERVDADAVFVDGHADDLQPGRARERKRVVVCRRVFEREPPRAGARERLDEQRDALGVAVADHDVVRPGRRASHAIEVRRERLVQRRGAAAAHIAELPVGRVGEHAPQRAQPGRSREPRAVGLAWAEVDPRARGGGSDGVPAGGSGPMATRV